MRAEQGIEPSRVRTKVIQIVLLAVGKEFVLATGIFVAAVTKLPEAAGYIRPCQYAANIQTRNLDNRRCCFKTKLTRNAIQLV